MISERFLKSTLIYSIGGALPMVSGFILLPFYTNQLSTNDYGLLMLYISFSLFMQVLFSYALDSYIGIHYVEHKDDTQRVKKLVGAVAGLLLVIGVVLISLSWLAGGNVFDLVFNSAGNLSFFPWGVMSVTTAFFNSFFKVYTVLLFYRKKPIRFFLFNLANFALVIGVSLIGLHLWPGSIAGPMLGRLLAGACIFALCLGLIGKEFGINFQFRFLTDLHRFCLPYLLYLLMAWALMNVDRFFINDLLSAEHVAVFDFAVKCTFLIEFLQNSIAAAINPETYDIWKRTNAKGTSNETNKYYNAFSGLSMLIIVGFILVIPYLVPLIVQKDAYFKSFPYMGALAAAFAAKMFAHYCLSILVYTKKTVLLPMIFLCTALIQLPLTYVLTKWFMIDGAVWATILSKVLQSLFFYLFIRSHFEIRINVYKMIIVPLLFIGASTLVWQLSGDSFSFLGNFAIGVLTVVTLFLLYRNEITALFTSVKGMAGKKIRRS